MIGLISSPTDPASNNMAEHLIAEYGFEAAEFRGKGCWKKENAIILEVDSPLVNCESVDELGFEVVYFLSKHRSAKGVSALTVHSLGNWSGEAKVGGRPRELSFAAPYQMLEVLKRIGEMGSAGFEKTYEATHHGPLLKTPSMFVELGGGEEAINNKKMAQRLSDKIHSAIFDGKGEGGRAVIGIGGTHYPQKFTRLALEKNYAFSHIMPEYAILNADGSDNLDVLEQALNRSNAAPEAAVVEWKSINAVIKDRVLNKLGEIGLDYERV